LAAVGDAAGMTRRRGETVTEALAHRFNNSTVDSYAVRHPKPDAATGV
jgi:hypothetical protein